MIPVLTILYVCDSYIMQIKAKFSVSKRGEDTEDNGFGLIKDNRAAEG